jgi:hypothetical protein
MRIEDYSRMVPFFDGKLFSSSGYFPLSAIALGFFLEEEDEGIEVMEVCADGFAEHRRGYFISSGSASGVMTGWRALMGIPNGGGFSLDAKGFFIEQCSWLPNKDFLQILCQGARVCAYSARVKVLECVQDSEDTYAQIKEIITRQIRKIKFHLYCRNSITPSTN